MKSAPASISRSVGRPTSGKKTYKVRLTPLARKVAGKKTFKLGLSDFSAYVETLIRKDNPDKFPDLTPTTQVPTLSPA